MSQPDPAQNSPANEPAPKSQGDPWHAFGLVSAGVLFYGFAGWLADRWLGTSFLVAVGILIGAGLGIYATVKRFDALPRWQKTSAQAREEEK